MADFKEKYGVENFKKALAVLAFFLGVGVDTAQGKKKAWAILLELTSQFEDLQAFQNGFGDLSNEIKDLDSQEIKESLEYFKSEFKIQDGMTEKKMELFVSGLARVADGISNFIIPAFKTKSK